MSEIIYNITKSKMDLLLNKVINLDEIKVEYSSDMDAMKTDLIKSLRSGIKEIRELLIEYESCLKE